MRTRVPAGAGSWAACLVEHGNSGGPAAADLRAVHTPGAVGGAAVRPAAPLSGPDPPAHRLFGRGLLPGGGRGHVPLPGAPGRGPAPGLCGRGSHRRRGAVFLRLFGVFAASVGLLGGYAGSFVASRVPAPAVGENFLQKNAPPGKKPLLFLAQMLYNREKWVQARERGSRKWQRNEKRQRR